MRRLYLALACFAVVISSLQAMAQDAPADPACPGAPVPRLIVNRRGEVSPGQSNRLRAQPSRNGEPIGQIPAEGEFIVLEGPVCAEGFNWWKVDFGGLVGWTAEGRDAEYWTVPLASQPVPSTATPFRADNPYLNPQYPVANAITVNAQARLQSLDGAALPLYAAPGSDSKKVADLPAGTIVTLLEDGAGGWWRVRVEGGDEGWLEDGYAAADRFPNLFSAFAPLCPYTTDRILFAAYDEHIGENLYTIGADGRHLCNLTYGAQLAYDHFAWSPDGSSVLFGGVTQRLPAYATEADLYIMSVNGRTVRRLTHGMVINGVAWSSQPGDLPIAFTRQNADNPNVADIYLTDPNGAALRRLTPESVRLGAVQWSPDGARLAFIQSHEDTTPYYESVMLLDPALGVQTELFASDWRVESLSWHPKGTSLLASVYINVGQNVLVDIDVASGNHAVLYDGSTRGAVYTGDGMQIAFWRAVMGAPRQLILLNRETQEITKLATLPGVNGRHIALAGDGQSLLVDSGGVLRVEVTTGKYRSLFLGALSSNFTPPLPQPGG
jgi:uncharacterized protein YraI